MIPKPTRRATADARALSSLPRRPATTFALLAVAASIGILIGGCAEEPFREIPAPTPSAPYTGGPPVNTAPVEAPKPSYRGPWEDPSSPLYRRTIYFDYDSVEIKPEYVAVMRTHSDYLGGNPAIRVTLEGNTDERGTREYNLALADRRAEAVRQFMLAEGVKPDQMATLSYGEERPADPAHSESAWRQNRRVIIQY